MFIAGEWKELLQELRWDWGWFLGAYTHAHIIDLIKSNKEQVESR